MISPLIWCQDHIWRKYFENKCFKSQTVPITGLVQTYLALDSVIVDISEEDNEVQSILRSLEFEFFLKSIHDSINNLSINGVIPRLNWSAPKDAEWMQSLCCKTPKEVLLLLKSSCLLTSDLELATQLNLQPMLNLSKYHKLKEGMIFRAFVKQKQLIAACQKDISAYYEYLSDLKPIISDKIKAIFEDIVEKCPLNDYTFDVYIDLPPRFRVFILGFNPFDDTTDPLMFTWEILNTMEEFQLSIVTENSIKSSSFSPYRVPIEISEGQDISEFLSSLNSK